MKKCKFRLAAAALSCVMLFSPLAAQAAEPVSYIPGTETELCEEENDTAGARLNCKTVTLHITDYDPTPMVGLYMEECVYYYTHESWSTSNYSVARVDSNGVVTGRSPGTATITCRTEYGESASCVVKVVKDVQTAELNESNFTLTMKYNDRNPSKQLYLSSGSGYLYGWNSSNTSVATVDSNGVVRAVGEGSSTITVLCSGRMLSCNVNVRSNIGKLSINKDVLLLKTVGGSEGLSAIIDGAGVGAAWSSSNPAVATVDANGVVTAVADGEATITASANGQAVSCTVYVGTSAEAYEESDAMAAALAIAGMTAIIGLSVAAAAD